MHRFRPLMNQNAVDLPPGAAAIAAGLAILAAALLFPGVPAVTAVSLVILGATSATLARLRSHAAILPILTAHVFVYGSLYALFVGSELHASAQSREGTHALCVFDLALSIGPLAVALERVWREVNTGRISQ